MKSLCLLLVFASAFAQAEEICASKLSQQLDLGKAEVREIRLTFDGSRYQVFNVKTNLWGGDAMTEAVVRKEDCRVVDYSLVWAE